MPGVDESIGAKTEIAGDLAAGVTVLSLNQEVTFKKYCKVVIPLDQFVFWVRADLLSPSAVNAASLGYTPVPNVLDVKGSLHYATQTDQNQDETLSINKVLFTSLEELLSLNEIGPNVLLLAEFDDIRFAFSSRSMFYRQTSLHHYTGDAVYADMEAQIIDDLEDFDTKSVVVSNSLPAWLSLNAYKPFYGFANPVQLYPSFTVPQNILPPFASVHIPPESTVAISGAPLLGPTMSSSQFVQETVQVTFWGLRNDAALQFVNCVLQWALDYDIIGVTNQPVVRDEKRAQSELNAIAMKKTAIFEVNYSQRRIAKLARGLITSAIPTFIFNDI